MPARSRAGEKTLRGIAVSAGVCRGRVLVLGRPQHEVPRFAVAQAQVPQEIQRFEQALTQTRKAILDVQSRVREGTGQQDASIFEAHLCVLEDPALISEVTRLVQEEHLNVEHAFQTVADQYIAAWASIKDDYLRERASDLRDVAERVQRNLAGQPDGSALHSLSEPRIVISHDLAPSATAQLDKKLVLGFATDVGSKTSHTAILARSLKIPAVVGLKEASLQLQDGEYVLLDGFNGLVIVNPTDQTLFEYGLLVQRQLTVEERLRDTIDQPAVTCDGVRVHLSANVEQASDAQAVRDCGADGVGLFRTEYLFIRSDHLPTEEEQFAAYRQVAAALQPHSVIIRTLDLGGDKFLSQLQVPAEMNPFLGWRAIRFCLQERAIFRTQLRAILRASTEGNVKIMYPMISRVDEIDQANELLEACKAELRTEGVAFDANIDTGAMIEIPSAVFVADALAKRVRFFSLGTNDLIQYALAVDRLNEKIAHLYDPTHPAIVHLIKMTVDAAHRNNLWVGVCGEMAGDIDLAPLLLGLGVDELSAAPQAVPQLKYLIRKLLMSRAKELAGFALTSDVSADILARCRALTRQTLGDLLDAAVPGPKPAFPTS